VEGLERTGQGRGDGVHHRRLDLDVAAAVEELPDVATMAAPQPEDLADLGFIDQVEIALAVAELTSWRPCHFSGRGGGTWQERHASQRTVSLAGARLEERPETETTVAEIEGGRSARRPRAGLVSRD